MSTLKIISLLISNIGGCIAIINLLWTVYHHRVNLSCYLTDIYHADITDSTAPVFFRLSIINSSNLSVSFHEISPSYGRLKQSTSFTTSKDKVFITMKGYEEVHFEYPLFTDALPVTLEPKGATSLLLEVFGNPDFNQISYLKIQTDHREVIVDLTKKLMKEVSLYQLR